MKCGRAATVCDWVVPTGRHLLVRLEENRYLPSVFVSRAFRPHAPLEKKIDTWREQEKMRRGEEERDRSRVKTLPTLYVTQLVNKFSTAQPTTVATLQQKSCGSPDWLPP
jgi:hypothetical protein